MLAAIDSNETRELTTADVDKQSKAYSPKHVLVYIKENPHMAVSIGLFCGGGVALWQNIAPLAGSLFGAGGVLLGAWVTELNNIAPTRKTRRKRGSRQLPHLRRN